MFYIELTSPRHELWPVVQHTLTYWGSYNKDGTGISWVNKRGEVKLAKIHARPEAFFKVVQAPLNPMTRIAGHVRAATEGNVKYENSHPFKSGDGRSTLMHNGVLTGWEKLKKRFIESGHKFTSETDSEILLHVLEEFGPVKAIEVLQNNGVRGSMNYIWLTPERTYAFSDGSLFILPFIGNRGIGIFSDLSPFPSRIHVRGEKLEQGTLVTIENGAITKQDVGTIKDISFVYYQDEGTSYPYHYGWKWLGGAWTKDETDRPAKCDEELDEGANRTGACR